MKAYIGYFGDKGVTFRRGDGGQLVAVGETDGLSEADVASIRENKAAILAWVDAGGSPPDPPTVNPPPPPSSGEATAWLAMEEADPWKADVARLFAFGRTAMEPYGPAEAAEAYRAWKAAMGACMAHVADPDERAGVGFRALALLASLAPPPLGGNVGVAAVAFGMMEAEWLVYVAADPGRCPSGYADA